MGWKDNLKNDFMGGSASGVPVGQDVDTGARYVEVPDDYDVVQKGDSYAIVPRSGGGLARNLLGAATGKTGSAAVGAVLNRVANSLNLLPDDDRISREFAKAPKSGVGSWFFSLQPKNVIATTLLGGEVGAKSRARNARNRLASEIEGTIRVSEQERSSADKVLELALDLLGDKVDDVLALADMSQLRGGVRSDAEREIATMVAADVEAVGLSVEEVSEGFIEGRKKNVVVDLGERVALHKERRRLEVLVKNPASEVPGCELGVTLVKAGFKEQLLAATFGAGKLNWKGFAGGQELYVGPDGKVYLRTGVETEVVAENISTLLTETDIATSFENLKAVVEKRFNLGGIGTVITKLAGDKDIIHSPGTLIVQRGGSHEEDAIVVPSLEKAKGGIKRLVVWAREAKERIDELDAVFPHLGSDSETFVATELGHVKREMANLPRTREVIEEARSIVSAREIQDGRLLAEVGIKKVNEKALQEFAGFNEEKRAELLEVLKSRTGGDEEKALRALSVLNRKSRKYRS